MASPKKTHIKESLPKLYALLRNSGYLISLRIKVLIEIKKNEETGISKMALSEITGVNHNSITSWRREYENNGIESLLTHGRIGFKKSVINSENHKIIEAKLLDPKNEIRGYVELQAWILENLKLEIGYHAIVKYCKRHFKTKIKVARKSHVNKDGEVVEAFKKTLTAFVEES